MTVQIDKAGRIVLPKRIRERLSLRPGSSLSVEEGPDGVLLRPLEQRISLVENAGMLVHMGQPVASLDWDRLVEDAREEHFRDIAGL